MTEDPPTTAPAWFLDLLDIDALPPDGGTVAVRGLTLKRLKGVLRSASTVSDAQKQTETVFGFKWNRRETFESPAMRAMMRAWATERYGAPAELAFPSPNPVVLDAGCGGAWTALEYWNPVLDRIRYLGVDISDAVDVAADRVTTAGVDCAFLQADLQQLPLRPASVDVIFSEGVLHHADSTRRAFDSLVPLLKPKGLFLFYVYRKKGPIREFTDDYIRDKIQSMTPDDAWKAIEPLTRLGQILGELNIEIEVPEAIDLLEIPAGRINLQRFFYWHVVKAWYRQGISHEEMTHINFDWFAPRNAHRQTPEEVRAWCADASLEILRERVEEAGISIVARRPG